MSFSYLFHDVNFQKIPNAFKLFVKEFKFVGKENHCFGFFFAEEKKICIFYTHCRKMVLSLLLIEYLWEDTME